jgi:C4-dicarboxylate-specific signal transduction histidine kinase
MKPRPPTSRTLAATAALTGLGVLGNAASIPFGYSLNLLFGSIASTVAVVTLGPVAGVTVAALASLYTWVLWNHPYAIVIFAAEAAWLAFAVRRGRRGLVLADTVFWLVLGAPLCVLFYRGAMHVDAQGTAVIALKQSLNGISNALVASLLVDHLPIARWATGGDDEARTATVADALFQITAALLIVPSFVVVVLDNRREAAEREREVTRALAEDRREVEDLVARWVERHAAVALAAADAGARHEVRPSADLQGELARLRALFPGLHNVYVADARAHTVAFDPPTNERGEATVGLDFSDRPYFADLVRTRAPGVSEIFLGRGGVSAPILALTAPILRGAELRGYSLVAANVDRLADELGRHHADGDATATLVDRRGRVITSTDPSVRPLEPAPNRPVTAEADPANDIQLHVPGATSLVTRMEVWKGAVYTTAIAVRGAPWTLRMERPIAPLQRELYEQSTRSLVLVAVLYALGLVVASAVSRALSRTPRTLADISRDLPQRLEDGREPDWPTSRVAEMRTLVANFRETADALRDRIAAIKAANAELEDRVADRTRELVEKTRELEAMTTGLERRVTEEVALRRRNEQLLAQQSKLAAMGEMIGAIAHQWRQPLNALALIVQNLGEELEPEGAEERARVTEAVGMAMAQIHQMSKTIDDFRSYFAPDRAESDVDLALATGHVLRLVAAQLSNAGITWTVTCEPGGRAYANGDAIEPFPAATVRARRNELEHVLHNLVNNAREAIGERRLSEGRGGRIDVTLTATDDRVRVDVRDDGGGVPPELVERIFEPYFTTKEGSGTGIGLYVARLILEEHCRARLSVRNEGEGAVFTIDLPRAAT